MQLVSTCRSRRVWIVDDRLVFHEQSDHVGQLSGMGEVDRVGRPVDDNKNAMVFLLTGDLLDARWTWEQRIPTSGNDQRWLVQGQQTIQSWILHQRSEHSEGARNAKSQVVRDSDA